MERSEAVQFFDKAVGRSRRQLRYVYLGMLLICASGLIYAGLDGSKSEMVARVIAASLLGGTFFLGLVVHTLLPSRLMAMLRSPETIAWYYAAPRASLLMVGDERGYLRGVELDPQDMESALEMLAELAPRARSGYSEEARVAFKRNPKGFARKRP